MKTNIAIVLAGILVALLVASCGPYEPGSGPPEPPAELGYLNIAEITVHKATYGERVVSWHIHDSGREIETGKSFVRVNYDTTTNVCDPLEDIVAVHDGRKWFAVVRGLDRAGTFSFRIMHKLEERSVETVCFTSRALAFRLTSSFPCDHAVQERNHTCQWGWCWCYAQRHDSTAAGGPGPGPMIDMEPFSIFGTRFGGYSR